MKLQEQPNRASCGAPVPSGSTACSRTQGSVAVLLCATVVQRAISSWFKVNGRCLDYPASLIPFSSTSVVFLVTTRRVLRKLWSIFCGTHYRALKGEYTNIHARKQPAVRASNVHEQEVTIVSQNIVKRANGGLLTTKTCYRPNK